MESVSLQRNHPAHPHRPHHPPPPPSPPSLALLYSEDDFFLSPAQPVKMRSGSLQKAGAAARTLGRRVYVAVYYPKGPCTQIVYTLGPMYPYREYFKAKVYTM